MPTPIDLKTLVKEFATDPKGLNLPTLPSTAITSGNATGNRGNWTGLYGHSERSIAVYGESPVFAGFFEGDVFVDGHLEANDASVAGNLTVKGDVDIRSVNQLVQNLAALATRVMELEAAGVTRLGTPTHVPVARPQIAVTAGQRSSDVTGHNFRPFGKIAFYLFNVTRGLRISVHDELSFDSFENNLITSRIEVKPDGTFFTREQLDVAAGDDLTFVATDGRSDPNDMSGLLWSNTVQVTVPF